MSHLTVADQITRKKEHEMRSLKRQNVDILRQGAAKGRKVLYIYLTNLPLSVEPGIVALLYKSRWDIEKVFDAFKNKFGETKSWASSATAKTNQARLICLTHNLMTLMEEDIRLRAERVDQWADAAVKLSRLKTRLDLHSDKS